MSHQDVVAAKAVRKSTLISIKQKKKSRLENLKRDYEEAVRQVNIQYSNDPERLKAKYAAEDYARNERQKARAERKINTEKRMVELAQNKRRFTIGEEISSAIIQGIGTCFSVAALAIYVALASQKASNFFELTLTMYSLFGSFMVLMYLFSIFRHALTNAVGKEVFQRLSHVCTYLVIGFGYTAYTLTKIQGVTGWVLFGCVWLTCAAGALLYAIGGSRFDRVSIILYAVGGFSGVFAARSLYQVLSVACLRNLWIAFGFYVLGLVLYALRKVKFMHFAGNCLMLVGNFFMFFSLLYLN